MGTVRFDLDAEEAKAVRGLLKVVDAQKKTVRASMAGNQAARGHEKAMRKLGTNAARDLKSMAAGWLTVGAVTGAAHKGLAMIIADLKRIKEQTTAATMTITHHIAGAGDLAQQQKIRSFLESGAFKGTGLTMEGRGQLYGAVRGAAPAAGLDRILGLTAVAAKSKRAALDPTAFGTTMGELSKIAPGKTAGDIGDLAAYITTQQGRYAKKINRGGYRDLRQFVAGGLGGAEEGIGMLLASVQASQGSMGFSTLLKKLREQRTVAGGKFGGAGGGGGAEGRFFAATPGQRLKMLRQDKALRSKIFGTEVATVEAMFDSKVGGLTAGARTAQTSDQFAAMQRQALLDPKFARQFGKAASGGRASQAEYTSDAAAGLDAADIIENRMRAGGAGPLRRGLVQFMLWASEIGYRPGGEYLEDTKRRVVAEEVEAARRDERNNAPADPNANAHTD